MVWISCKRLAQQFDLNQFQKEIVANDFPFCKEQQKILVVLDLLFAKKSHTIKNIARIANAVQVTFRLYTTTPQSRSKSKSLSLSL